MTITMITIMMKIRALQPDGLRRNPGLSRNRVSRVEALPASFSTALQDFAPGVLDLGT
jgi:hypothetical protein